jgi:hypothetical protein
VPGDHPLAQVEVEDVPPQRSSGLYVERGQLGDQHCAIRVI